MYCSALTLFLLSLPFLTQAGPVASDQSLQIRNDVHSTDLIARAGDDDNCRDTATCTAAGQKLWDALQTKLKDGNAKDETKYDGKLKSDYSDRVTRDATPDYATFQSEFKKNNLDFEKHFADHSVRGNDDDKEAFQNMFNTNQGTMVGVWNFKQYDTKNIMPFSEVIFQCYKKECDEQKELKSFQFAGVQNAANTEYLTVVDDLYTKRKLKKIADEFNKWTFEEQKDGFLALLATQKVSFVLRMLTDHSEAFGKRVPTEVWTNKLRRAVYVRIDEFKG
ncbi:MAG: hypothetical protein Q9222_007540 [Ikaeria aurantiellina]